MNKKILSIFALIMALSFAVSCSNENTTGNGGGSGTGTPTEVTKAQVEEFLKKLADVKEEGSAGTEATFAFGDSTLSGSEFASAAADKQPTITKALKALQTALKALPKTDSIVVLAIDDSAIDSLNWVDPAPTSSDKNPGKVNVTLKVLDEAKYELPTELKTITIVLTANSSSNWQ